MSRVLPVRVRNCLVLVIVWYAVGCAPPSGSREHSVMSQYSQDQWLDAGATVSYTGWSNEVVIRKSRPTPAWGGAILELGALDLSRPNHLTFEVVGLRGQYAVMVHYGGMQRYETQHVKIQEDTSMMGKQEYDVREALRMEGLRGPQKIAIQILVIDPLDEPGAGMVRLKHLMFVTES